MYVYDIGADRCSTVHRYGHSMNTGIQIYRYGPFTLFFCNGIPTYTYIRILCNSCKHIPQGCFLCALTYVCMYGCSLLTFYFTYRSQCQ